MNYEPKVNLALIPEMEKSFTIESRIEGSSHSTGSKQIQKRSASVSQTYDITADGVCRKLLRNLVHIYFGYCNISLMLIFTLNLAFYV